MPPPLSWAPSARFDRKYVLWSTAEPNEAIRLVSTIIRISCWARFAPLFTKGSPPISQPGASLCDSCYAHPASNFAAVARDLARPSAFPVSRRQRGASLLCRLGRKCEIDVSTRHRSGEGKEGFPFEGAAPAAGGDEIGLGPGWSPPARHCP